MNIYLLRAGKRQKEITELVEKDKSVISRELKRNNHKRGYSARLAQEYADKRKERYRLKRRFTERTTGSLLMKKLPKGKNAKALAKEIFLLLGKRSE
jgi:IS30 family transposase